MKKIMITLFVISMLAVSVGFVFAAKPDNVGTCILANNDVVATGFDEYGYNRCAHQFVGTGMSWCMGKFGNAAWCEANYGPWGDDKLKMKWNAEWDRGNVEDWNDGPYDAYLDNQWNGMVPSGSGETWHYMIKWIDGCGPDESPTNDGGYCIWGQFEVIMSHGTVGGEHIWDTHAIPSGYGA